MILDLLIAFVDGLADAWLLYGPSRRPSRSGRKPRNVRTR